MAKRRIKSDFPDALDLILNIATDIYETLGSGHSEEVYHRSMQVGLRLQQVKYEPKKVCELKYKDHYVGECYPDLVVWFDSEKVVVELKALAAILGPAEEQQLRNYMSLVG